LISTESGPSKAKKTAQVRRRRSAEIGKDRIGSEPKPPLGPRRSPASNVTGSLGKAASQPTELLAGPGNNGQALSERRLASVSRPLREFGYEYVSFLRRATYKLRLVPPAMSTGRRIQSSFDACATDGELAPKRATLDGADRASRSQPCSPLSGPGNLEVELRQGRMPAGPVVDSTHMEC
jgi:hypothetical protein